LRCGGEVAQEEAPVAVVALSCPAQGAAELAASPELLRSRRGLLIILRSGRPDVEARAIIPEAARLAEMAAQVPLGPWFPFPERVAAVPARRISRREAKVPAEAATEA
jgi:hypothetical protein